MIAATVNVVGQGISLATVQKMATHLVRPCTCPAAALLNLRAVGAAAGSRRTW